MAPDEQEAEAGKKGCGGLGDGDVADITKDGEVYLGQGFPGADGNIGVHDGLLGAAIVDPGAHCSGGEVSASAIDQVGSRTSVGSDSFSSEVFRSANHAIPRD